MNNLNDIVLQVFSLNGIVQTFNSSFFTVTSHTLISANQKCQYVMYTVVKVYFYIMLR